MTAIGEAARSAGRAVQRSTVAVSLARVGLVGRAGFYLLLAYLAARVALLRGDGGRQANAQGALSIVSANALGKVAVAAVAFGFVAFGAERVVAAWRDRECSRGRRITTALQGLFYLVLAYVPVSFLVGNHATGSEAQQHHTASGLLALPGGQVLVTGLGLVVAGVCAWQVRTAVSRDFDDGLRTGSLRPRTRRVVVAVGVAGIAARALVFLPVGVFLVLAGLSGDPRRAQGLDGELLDMSRHAWGTVVLLLVVVGLLVFAAYSLIEARFRDLRSSE